MENNENLVTEVTENVEQTTEQTPKTYTEEEFNAKLDEVLGKKIARKEAKIRKEYQQKYGDLETVLKAGTGKQDVQEMTDAFRQFYEKKGLQIPKKPTYTDREEEVLAKADAADIISAGFDEVVEEVERLTNIGAQNMTARERAVFKTLAEYRNNAERGNALAKMGVTEDVYTSKEFQEFASMFNASTPVDKIYSIYANAQPKKEIKPMGSMKNSNSGDNGVKEFYTPDEARKFSVKDYDKNPALYEAVRKSMTKW